MNGSTFSLSCYRKKGYGVDLKARVFTAETKNIIGQYIIFSRVFDEQIQKYGRTKEAAEEAIRICKDRKVLVDYLKDREKEVINTMIMLFDQEYAQEQALRAQRRAGREEGHEEGREEGREELIRTMLDSGKKPEDISEFCHIPLEEVKAVLK